MTAVEAFVALCVAFRNNRDMQGIRRADGELERLKTAHPSLEKAWQAANELCRQAGVYGLNEPLEHNVAALVALEAELPDAVTQAREALKGSRNILI